MKTLKCKIICGLLGVGLACALGLFQRGNRGDIVFAKIPLAAGETVRQVIDLGRVGELKYRVAPNVISAYLHVRPVGGQGKFSYRLDGLEVIVAERGKKRNWRPLTNGASLPRRQGEVRFALEILVPRAAARRRECQSGELTIFRDGRRYGTVAIDIVNSRGEAGR